MQILIEANFAMTGKYTEHLFKKTGLMVSFPEVKLVPKFDQYLVDCRNRLRWLRDLILLRS